MIFFVTNQNFALGFFKNLQKYKEACFYYKIRFVSRRKFISFWNNKLLSAELFKKYNMNPNSAVFMHIVRKKITKGLSILKRRLSGRKKTLVTIRKK